MLSVLGVALLTLALSGPTGAFVPIGGGASTHVSITGTALLQKVMEACKALAEKSGYEFEPTGSSAEELVQACLGPTATGDVSAAKFHTALQAIYTQNGLVDRDLANSAPHHFNSESFPKGRDLIIQGILTIKSNIKSQSFQAARETLGRTLHVLQDFYSHSNWVELGYNEPYINLIRADLPLENLADEDTATCGDCESGTCSNPLLPNILDEKKLTSGYIGIYADTKPGGKCSHGGKGDMSSSVKPRGGISKDERRVDNSVFHDQAVRLATEASLQLLEDIRLAAGNQEFLRMMGIARSSVLCFVIDTTGSMSDDIDEARNVAYKIIDSKRGTQDEPSEYILVTFNDPDFELAIRTADPDKMKSEIRKLRAAGGGDYPEMCLSGLQLALTSAPASSNIYIFTDAPAKDIALKDTIIALIRSTKSTVSYFLTSSRRRRRRSLRDDAFTQYNDLALISGGQVIQVSKAQLPQATDIILDTSTSALVTVLQLERKSGPAEDLSFMLDESLKNITIYITGTSLKFTLTNPGGLIQSESETNGQLGTIKAVGNLGRIRLHDKMEAGNWKIKITSTGPYTLKVTGQSLITFIYDFVERFEGPHPGYAVLSGRPQAGQPAMLMLTVMGRRGPESLEITEAGLVSASTSQITSGKITDMGNGAILMTVDKVPEGEFVVILKGTEKGSKNNFQRQSTTQMSVSKVFIQAVVNSSMEPGVDFEIPFSVVTEGASGTFKINAQNDRGFKMVYNKSITLKNGTISNFTLTMSPSLGTTSGTDVTLTVEVKGDDSNYIVLRLSVVEEIKDFTPPLCEVVSVMENCTGDRSQCESVTWTISANITDRDGTGIEGISVPDGSGNLTLNLSSLDDTMVEAKYETTCCSQFVELVVLDKVGNVGKCTHSLDLDPPSCDIFNVTRPADNCPKDMTRCRDFQWSLKANFTDGNGTGVIGVSVDHGNGKLNLIKDSTTVVEADYTADCCAQTVDLKVIDKADNRGTCSYSIVSSASPSALSLSLPFCLLMSFFIGRVLSG